MTAVNPEEDIPEPEQYTTEPEDVSDVQDDNAEGAVSELAREHGIDT